MGLTEALAFVAWVTPAKNASLRTTRLPMRAETGFDRHAGLVVPAVQRDRLERVCRYALRPPVTDERTHLNNRRR